MYKGNLNSDDDEKDRTNKRKRVIGSTSTEDLNTPDRPLIKKAIIEPHTEAPEGSLSFKKEVINLQFGERGSSDEFEDISKVKAKVENIMKAHFGV